MNQKKWSGDEAALFDALQQLIDERFSTLPSSSLQQVFSAIVEQHGESEDGADEESSGWTDRISSDEVGVLDSSAVMVTRNSDSEVEAHAAVEIVVRNPSDVLALLEQILEVGAVMVQMEPPPDLNELMEMTLTFPEAHLTIESSGRVVNNSERGTAIEVSGLGREDRVSLAAMQDELRSRQPDLEQSEEDSTAAVDDSIQEPSAVQPVFQDDDPRRSFAPINTTSGRVTTGSNRHGKRRMVTTSRRSVELPDPDMNVATSTRRVTKQDGKSTREFFGPPPPWYEVQGEAERVETLSQERVLDILLQLSEDGFTGLLMFDEHGERREQLLFDSGYVVERSVKPRQTDEELGPMLLAADHITKRQLAMAAAHADELGLGVARSLMDLGILNPDQLRHAIAGRLTFLLREFCDRQQGVVRIYESHTLPAGFLPQPPLRVHVAVERIIYDRLYRRLAQYSTEEREERMQPHVGSYPEIIGHQRDRLERAVGQPEQMKFVEQTITGNIRMREVMTESSLRPPETFATVFSLHRMGLVRFDRSLHETVVRERLRENITVKHMSVHKASYFEVLNVHWSSYSEVIEEAYQRLVDQFAIENMPDDLAPDIQQKVEEINERLEAAYAALAKRKTRHAYRTRIMPEYKLDHAIPLFLKQCELAERRQNWVEARDAILRVLEIEPDHEEAKRKLDSLDEHIEGRAVDPAETFP